MGSSNDGHNIHFHKKEEKKNANIITQAGLPRSGKNIWKTKFFPGQGKVREFCGWPGNFGRT